MLRWSSTVLIFTLFGFSCPVVYAESEAVTLQCPGSVAVIAGNRLASSAHEKVERLYRRLGCDTRFEEYPGQRGIVEFNQGLIDGELMRIRPAESEYQRDFVRSLYPVAEFKRALWLHPDQSLHTDQPIGYQLGVVWQKREAAKQSNVIQFYSSEELFEAYRQGRIRGFLSSYLSEQAFIELNQLEPAPNLDWEYSQIDLYHYLGKEFTPFMLRFSKLLQSRGP